MPNPNVFKAVIRPRRVRSDDVQDVRLEIFNWDGSPFESGGGSTSPEHGEWTTVPNSSMSNGWTNQNSMPFRYRKRGDGVVECQGHLDPGSAGVVFTFPEGCRPPDTGDGFLGWAAYGNDGKMGMIAVQSDGKCIVTWIDPAANYITTACVRFSTD